MAHPHTMCVAHAFPRGCVFLVLATGGRGKNKSCSRSSFTDGEEQWFFASVFDDHRSISVDNNVVLLLFSLLSFSHDLLFSVKYSFRSKSWNYRF